MKLFRWFKRKKQELKMEQCMEAFKKTTDNKMAAAKKLINVVDNSKLERRCGIIEYHGPERRIAGI